MAHHAFCESATMLGLNRLSFGSAVAHWVVLATLAFSAHVVAEPADAVAKVKSSVVAVGYFKETNSPRFLFRGTGFAVLDGNTLATNAHVVLSSQESDGAALAITIRTGPNQSQTRRASVVDVDTTHDLALLRFDGPALPALSVRTAESAREGQAVLFMGFPIGGALGFSAVTHRGIISSITPVALPGPTASQLDAKTIGRLREGSFDLFQLDATAYPGNSGGPLFDADTGEVIGVINMVTLKNLKESSLIHPSGISYAIPARFLVQLLNKHR